MKFLKTIGFSMFAMLFLMVLPPAYALQTCIAVDQSMDEVLPGVTLTWDSSHLCANAPDFDTYEFAVSVTNHGTAAEPVRIEEIQLVKTTPCPRRRCAGGSITSVSGLPTGAIGPGTTVSFTVRGSYQLVRTDEGKKANLHFLAQGEGTNSGKLFAIGINAHFRAPGVAAD